MKKAVLLFGLILSFAALGIGQVRTITDSTLQKFQQKRLDAERNYRDNYARMGFPSPEELDRQRETDMAARLQLAEQLRQARLERERIELERQGLMLQAAALERERDTEDSYNNGFYGGYFGGYGGFYSNGGFFDGRFGSRRRHFGGFGRFTGGGYRATPVGVYPTPIRRTRPLVFRSTGRAIIRTGRH
jgi:hypothetical protein